MPSNPERVASLHDALVRAGDARKLTSSAIWREAWEAYERELVEQLVELGPIDHEARYMLVIAIKAARTARRIIEHESQTIDGLQKELAFLTGEIKPAIA